MTLNPDPSLPSAKQQGDLVNHIEFNSVVNAIKEHREELTDRLSEDTLEDAFNARQATSEKGEADGYAGLDGDGKVPEAHLPEHLAESELTAFNEF